MSKSSEQFFKDLLSKIPKETSILVEKQMDIAVAIGEAIEKTGMTKKEFAKKIGMKESYISRVCAGNVNLTLKTIAKFEAALNETFIQVPMFAEQKERIEVFVNEDEEKHCQQQFDVNKSSHYNSNQKTTKMTFDLSNEYENIYGNA